MSDIVRTTLGPKSMLKMLLDPMGGIVLTNDGNAILREVKYLNYGYQHGYKGFWSFQSYPCV